MKHALDLFSLSGRVSRRAFVGAGVALFALKYLIDSVVSAKFGQAWHPLMYLSPRVSPLLHPVSQAYWVALLAVAAPFIAAGVSLCARRLRDMGQSPFWAGLFFLPFLHFAFFAVLCFAPSAKEPEPPPGPDPGPYRAVEPVAGAPSGAGVRERQRERDGDLANRLIPHGKGGAFLFGLVLSLAVGLASFVIAVQISRTLGTLLFIGTPFAMGFLTTFCVAYRGPVTLGGALGWSATPILISLLILIAVAGEGVACLVMALPILILVAFVGGAVARASAYTPLYRATALFSLFTPALVGLGGLAPTEAPEPLAVVSTVTIAAPPETVWKNVVSFSTITAEPSPVFALCAMPVRARIEGEGPGALRRCEFTNGVFEEPIQVWDAPRELTFGVRAQPVAIDEYIDVTRGQFLLQANADGTTTLRGTTWYGLKVRPVAYWSRWTSFFLHAIHDRVIDHVKHLSEHPDEAAATECTHAGESSGACTHATASAAIPEWMAAAHETCRCTRHPTSPRASQDATSTVTTEAP